VINRLAEPKPRIDRRRLLSDLAALSRIGGRPHHLQCRPHETKVLIKLTPETWIPSG